MGVVCSAIGSFLSAIGGAIMTIIGAITSVIADLFFLIANVVDTILCCRCCSRGNVGGSRYSRRRGAVV